MNSEQKLFFLDFLLQNIFIAFSGFLKTIYAAFCDEVFKEEC